MNPHHNTKRHHTHQHCEMVIDVNRRDHYGQPALCCSEHIDKKGRLTWIDWLSKTDEIALLNLGVKQTKPTTPSPLMQKALQQAKLIPKTPKKDSWIDDLMLNKRWYAIKKQMTDQFKGYTLYIVKGQLNVWNRNHDKSIYIAKKKQIMRLKTRLDWVSYRPKDLAHAIETDTIEQYYAQQLTDPRSYPNVWKRKHEEIDTKEYYANRVGRQLDRLDNI